MENFWMYQSGWLNMQAFQRNHAFQLKTSNASISGANIYVCELLSLGYIFNNSGAVQVSWKINAKITDQLGGANVTFQGPSPDG